MKLVDSVKNIVVLSLFITPFGLSAQDKILAPTEVPGAIQSYVKKHFAGQTIAQAKLDVDGLKKEYEIKLSDQTKLEFTDKHKITKIDANKALPASVVPQKIAQYVKANYPNHSIIEWKKDERKQEIKLDNKLEMEFNLKGDFVRIDD